MALLGSSGNSKLAHLHFAIKLQPTGIYGIAKIEEDLKKLTPPIEFIKKWSRDTENEDINVVRKHRDRNWKMYEQEKKLREEVGRDYQALKEKANELKSQKEEYAAKLGVSDRHEDILQAIKQLKDAEDGERELKKELDGCMAEKVTIEDKLRAMESAKDNVEARESTVKTEAGMNFIPKGGVSIWQKIQTWWYRQNFR